MLNEITKISLDKIREAAQDGESITIIINGEYYDLEATANNNDFMDGVKFAAAVIEDRQARTNHCLNYKPTKKAREANEKTNRDTKSIIDFLEYITEEPNSFSGFYSDYIHGNLWRLEK